jgi:nitrogen fixation protein NifZ
MLNARFDIDDAVRITRTVRNDGTYPGVATGEKLVRCGSVGYVRDLGTFLQDQIIYSVHFMDADNRIVGCRENELIPADAPWVPSRFEVRDKVIARLGLSVKGNTLVVQGDQGEVVKVLRDEAAGVHYHVRFSQRTFEVPEDALTDFSGEARRG